MRLLTGQDFDSRGAHYILQETRAHAPCSLTVLFYHMGR
jgi:hypothetical protein